MLQPYRAVAFLCQGQLGQQPGIKGFGIDIPIDDRDRIEGDRIAQGQ
ncbi:MAG: hypothetical protein H6Q64_1737, partial [Firmicutes bacterium]|nr:hypothetical protein [Bacillota bacterium]